MSDSRHLMTWMTRDTTVRFATLAPPAHHGIDAIEVSG
jgi:hypothetical protein